MVAYRFVRKEYVINVILFDYFQMSFDYPLHEAAELDAKTERLQEYERQFAWSCRQVDILNDKARESRKHYQQAVTDNYRSFRYRHRLRLAVVEGVRNVFLEFARDIAEAISDLCWELYCDVVYIYDQNDTIQLVYPSDRDDDYDGFDIDSYVGYDDDEYYNDEDDNDVDNVGAVGVDVYGDDYDAAEERV